MATGKCHFSQRRQHQIAVRLPPRGNPIVPRKRSKLLTSNVFPLRRGRHRQKHPQPSTNFRRVLTVAHLSAVKLSMPLIRCTLTAAFSSAVSRLTAAGIRNRLKNKNATDSARLLYQIIRTAVLLPAIAICASRPAVAMLTCAIGAGMVDDAQTQAISPPQPEPAKR
jgi:hypothetical protein